MMEIFNQPLEVVRPGVKRSAYSSQVVPDWDNATFEDVGFLVSVQPRERAQETDKPRVQSVSTLWLCTPPGTDIAGLDSGSRVRVGGVLVCEVEGHPARWPDPYNPGTIHHLEANLVVAHG